MTRESFPDPEHQPPSEAARRDFAYLVDILTERGIEIQGVHLSHMGIYDIPDGRKLTVIYLPNDGTPVDEGKNIDPLLCSADVEERMEGEKLRVTRLELAKSEKMRITVRETDRAFLDKRFNERLRAEVAGDAATAERIDAEMRRQEKARESRADAEEAFGFDIPTETDVVRINELLRSLVEKLRE